MKERTDVCRIALSASEIATSTGINVVNTIALARRRPMRPSTGRVTSFLPGRLLLDQLLQKRKRVETPDRFEVQCRRLGGLHSVDEMPEWALVCQPVGGPSP